MHPLQSHILQELNLKESAHYGELKPLGVESNKFVYHLKCVAEAGLVAKTGSVYALTAPGKRYVGRLSLKNFQPRLQPKIVTVTIMADREGSYLLMDSKRQPFFQKLSFPYGKIHFGESILQAAQRELQEKTGLTAHLQHRGDMYLSIKEQGELVAHMLCHVFTGSKPQGTLTAERKTHTVAWQPLNAQVKKRFVPGFLAMQRLCAASKKKFFCEIMA